MKRSTIEKAVDFFYPFLDKEAYIIFYGGEPLLAFDNIKYTVYLLQEKDKKKKKKLKFSLSTNGSLITDEMLDFFDRRSFDIMLSFDGLVQEIGRKTGSLKPTRELIKRIQKDAYPGIKFSTNSVFSPETVGYLSASLQYIIESGVTDLQFDLTLNDPWDETALQILEKELETLSDFLGSFYKKTGTIPIGNFKKVEAPPKKKESDTCFTCDAGLQRMAITPEENLWGCYVFHDCLKNRKENSDFQTYSFGKLDNFIKNYKTIYLKVILNYSSLRQNVFFTENQYCFLCEDVNICSVCPVSAAYTTSFIGKISPWVCSLKRLLREKRKRFLEEVNNISL